MANALKTLFTDIAAAIRTGLPNEGAIAPLNFPTKIEEAIAAGSGADEDVSEALGDVFSRNTVELLDIKSLQDKGVPITFFGQHILEDMNITYIVSGKILNYEAYSLANIAELKIIDTKPQIFSSLGRQQTTFEANSLIGCSALESIIVRFEEGYSNNSLNFATGSFDSTTGDFYIYVPSAFYDDCVANSTNVSSGASAKFRKLEDYPDIDNWRSNL